MHPDDVGADDLDLGAALAESDHDASRASLDRDARRRDLPDAAALEVDAEVEPAGEQRLTADDDRAPTETMTGPLPDA